MYKKIKSMSVDEYLSLYNKFVDDISNRNISTINLTSSGTYTKTGISW